MLQPDASIASERGNRFVLGQILRRIGAEDLQLGQLDVAAGRIAGGRQTELADIEPNVAGGVGRQRDRDRTGGDGLRASRSAW